jgi:hypothetical protein
VSDATSNSEGSQIIGNTLESAQGASVAGIDIEGSDRIVVFGNRIEYNAASQAHIYVHGGTAAAKFVKVLENDCLGTAAAAVKFGTGVGSSKVVASSLKGGSYSGTVVINSDCDYTTIELDRRTIVDGAGNLTNSGVSSRLTYADDQAITVGITGLTTSPTALWKYTVANGIVTLFAQALNGTSNSTACTITGLPALIRPTNSQTVTVIIQDNTSTQQLSKGVVDSSGVITLSRDASGAVFTNVNTKGILSCTITYPLF